MRPLRVAILGGSGFLGRQIASTLANSECEIVVPTRVQEHAKQLSMLPRVRIPEVNVRDAGALAAALDGVDALINLVGILHDSRRESFDDIHVGVTQAAIDACRAAGIRRLIQVSALNAGTDAPSAYLRSKGAAEARVVASGLDWTIFQPSVIFGPGDRFLNLFAGLARYVPVLGLASAQARFQPIHVGDVAAAIAAALDDPRTFGQRYPLCGPKVYTLRELVAYAAHQSGHPRLIFPLPASLGRMQAWLLEHLPGQLMTRDNLLSMQVDSVCNCPFPAVFGFAPRTLEDAVPEYLPPTAASECISRYRRGHR